MRAAGTHESGRPAAQSAGRQAAGKAAHPQATQSSAAATSHAQPSASPAPQPSSSGSIGGKPTPTKPFLIYDSVTPSSLPTGRVVATYATGGRPAKPAELAGRGPVLWIDVIGSDPGADVLDVEPGAVSASAVPGWITQRLTAHPGALAVIYTSIGQWALLRSEVAGLPAAMRSQVRWWIADPTGYAHIVPGSDATQWYWGSNYDISTATPRI